MTNRISKDDLQIRVDYLNKITDNNPEVYQRGEDGEYLRDQDNRLIPNLGTYSLGWVNGEVCLETKAGSVTVLCWGSRRDLYNRLNSFIYGIEIGINIGLGRNYS